MGYIELNRVTGDPFVDVEEQLNDNWDTLDAKFAAMQAIGDFSDPEIGQEVIVGSGSDLNLAVYDGTTWNTPTDLHNQWSAWTAVPLAATTPIIRPGFPLVYRVNTGLRKGELSGGLRVDTSDSAWTPGTLVTASNSSVGGLSSYTPTHTHYFNTSSSSPSTNVAGSRAILDTTNSWRLRVQFMGTSGGGNFIMLDGVEWHY